MMMMQYRDCTFLLARVTAWRHRDVISLKSEVDVNLVEYCR